MEKAGLVILQQIPDIAAKALAMDFRMINPQSARIILVEAGPRVLANFHADLSENAKRSLELRHDLHRVQAARFRPIAFRERRDRK